MRKINKITIESLRIFEDVFKEDAYNEYKINKYLDDGLLSPYEAAMMIGYIKA